MSEFEFTKMEFKSLLKMVTGCSIQHNGWHCSTCFYTISPTLRNKHWRAVLAWRGDYPDMKFTATRSQLVKDIYHLAMVRMGFLEETRINA